MENLDFTNIHFISSLGAGAVMFLLAAFVLVKNPYTSVNKFFAAFSLSVTLWAFGSAIDAAALKPEISLVWNKIGSMGGILMGPLFLLFIFAFTKNYKRLNSFITHIFLIGISFFIYSWIFIIKPENIEDFYRAPWGWESKISLTPIQIFGAVGWVPLLMLLGLWLCWRFYQKTQDSIEKKQALLIIIAGSIPLLLGVLSQLTPTFLNTTEEITIASKILFALSSVFLGFVLFYAAIRHKLFIGLTVATTADAVIETMKDVLIITNPRVNIEIINPFALRLLGYKKDEILGKPLGNILPVEEWDKFIKEIMPKIREGEDIVNIEMNFLSAERKLVPMSIFGGSFKNERGELIGVMIVAKDMRDTKKLVEELEEKSSELAEKIRELEKARETAEKTRLATLNILEDVEEARAALQERVEDLEKFNRLAVGRELKMIELKDEIKKLRGENNKK